MKLLITNKARNKYKEILNLDSLVKCYQVLTAGTASRQFSQLGIMDTKEYTNKKKDTQLCEEINH